MIEDKSFIVERESKERVKLMKMSKGYQWEISLLPEEGILLIDKDFERLENRNKKLEETYGKNN